MVLVDLIELAIEPHLAAIQQDDAEQAFQALSSFAGEHGMKIVRSSNP